MTDAKNRTDSVTMETGEVICGRCRRPLSPLVIEEIEGISQLRAGSVLIPKMEANCLHCGWAFYWNIREKDIEKMTLKYQQLISLYSAE
jgi:RNase P subunit RPR2